MVYVNYKCTLTALNSKLVPSRVSKNTFLQVAVAPATLSCSAAHLTSGGVQPHL